MSVNDASSIIIDDSRVMLQIGASLTDNSRVIIYDRNMFIVQDIGLRSVPESSRLLNACQGLKCYFLSGASMTKK
jgi:hypothetical protein